MADLLLGLDLGKRSDYSALAEVYRAIRLGKTGLPERDTRGDALYRFHCPRLHRWVKGTDYTQIIDDIEERLSHERYPDPTRLVIDATGVGGGVVEMFHNRQIPKLQIIPVMITSGASFSRIKVCKGLSGYSVAKYLIASTMQAIFQGRHIRVNSEDPNAKTLVKELMGFQVKLTAAGNERFEHRDGEHDDLVLALAIVLWVAGVRSVGYLNNAKVGQTAKETATLEAEQIAEAEAIKNGEKDDAEKAKAEALRLDREAQKDINNPRWWL